MFIDFFNCGRQLKTYFTIEEEPENAGVTDVIHNILKQLDELLLLYTDGGLNGYDCVFVI